LLVGKLVGAVPIGVKGFSRLLWFLWYKFPAGYVNWRVVMFYDGVKH
jgi:hypothetical protein